MMSSPLPIEQLVQSVQDLDRGACAARLRQMRNPRLDFSDAFLAGQSDEQLRHLLLAALIQSHKSPAPGFCGPAQDGA
jgi:hypothetical protein